MAEDLISVLLVGKAGNGKSATGNSIIGKKKFKTAPGTRSTTKECQREVARVQGHNVVVVDSPGLADTDITTDGGLQQFTNEVINIFTLHPDSFDVIVITLRCDLRITEEERRVINDLDRLFEEHFVKQCGIFIVTHADSYKPEEKGNIPIEQSAQSQSVLFTELLKKCNGRVVYFDNKTKDQSIRCDQVKRLLDLADKVKQNPPRAPSEIFVTAQKAGDEILKQARRPIIHVKTETSLLLIIEDLESIPPKSRDVQLLEVIRTRIQQQHRQLFEQNKPAGKLDNAISIVFRLEEAVTMRIAAIKNNEKKSKMTQAVEHTSEIVGELKEFLRAYAELKVVLMNAKLPPVLAPIITKLILASNSRYKPLRSRQGCRLL